MSIKMAKPQGIKLVIKTVDDGIKAINSGVTDKYKLFVVVESIRDAYRFVKETSINSMTLGGTKSKENTKNISKAVNITAEEESLLKELIKDGTEVEIRMVPNDTKVLAEKVL